MVQNTAGPFNPYVPVLNNMGVLPAAATLDGATGVPVSAAAATSLATANMISAGLGGPQPKLSRVDRLEVYLPQAWPNFS